MSKYTTEVRFICESYAGLPASGDFPVSEVVTRAAPKVFEKFPIFDEAYRLPLECKILKHYYTREISHETVGLWKHYLNQRMDELMPLYNQLYKSQLLEFNPLINEDTTIEHTKKTDKNQAHTNTTNLSGNVTGTDTSHANGLNIGESSTEATDTGDSHTETSDAATRTSDNWDKYSDTPQGSLSDVSDGRYLTNARNTDTNDTENKDTTTDVTTNNEANTDSASKLTSTTDTNANSNTKTDNSTVDNGTQTANDMETYLEHIRGKAGDMTYPEMIMKLRDSFRNIDMEIIDSLADLFFNLY